jgi:hypothetical protein
MSKDKGNIEYVTCCICGKTKSKEGQMQLAALDLSPWGGPKGLSHIPCGVDIIHQIFKNPQDIPRKGETK